MKLASLDNLFGKFSFGTSCITSALDSSRLRTLLLTKRRTS